MMLCILYDAPHMCLCKIIIMYYTLQDGDAFTCAMEQAAARH